MKTYLLWCIMLLPAIAYSMEPDIPDQKTLQIQLATIANKCFKDKKLTQQEQGYVLTALAEFYADHENEALYDLQNGKLKAQHQGQLRTSILTQIEGNLNRAIKSLESDKASIAHEEEQQRATGYLCNRIILVVVATIMVTAFLGIIHNA
ncbi:MAG: hypothetical protein ACHQVS_04035 [Candidatus Babeliales bacterium]